MDEKELIHNLKKKDEKYLIKTIEQYSAYVCTIIRNVANNFISECDVEEIASEVFIKLWKNTKKLRKDGIKAYISAIARNLTIDYLRRKHREVPFEEIELTDSFNIEDEVVNHIEEEMLKTALNDLKPKHKELLLRFYFLYQSISQISKEMNISISSCKTELHRAKKELKSILVRKGYDYEK